jgi:hypothetical protein
MHCDISSSSQDLQSVQQSNVLFKIFLKTGAFPKASGTFAKASSTFAMRKSDVGLFSYKSSTFEHMSCSLCIFFDVLTLHAVTLIRKG